NPLYDDIDDEEPMIKRSESEQPTGSSGQPLGQRLGQGGNKLNKVDGCVEQPILIWSDSEQPTGSSGQPLGQRPGQGDGNEATKIYEWDDEELILTRSDSEHPTGSSGQPPEKRRRQGDGNEAIKVHVLHQRHSDADDEVPAPKRSKSKKT